MQFKNKEQIMPILLSVVICVFVVYVTVYGATTISGNITTGSATTTDSLEVGGYASTTGALNTMSTLHVGGNADVDGTFNIGNGSSITKYSFGVCNIAGVTITASSTAFIDCTSATGVASSDKVFVMATSSLPTNFVIQAASSSVANVINLRIVNLGYDGTTATGGRSFYWQAIR